MAYLHSLHSLPDEKGGHLGPIDDDPILAGVRRNLTMVGGEISEIVKAGSTSASTDIMSVIHLMASGQSHAAPVTTQAHAPSSLGPALGAGVAGLAAGAGATALAMSGGGGSKTPAAKTSDGGKPPAPPTEVPAAKGVSAPTKPTPPPGGSADVPEPPTKAPIDPNVYSGFEEPELGKGTTITLGGKYDAPKTPSPKPAVVTTPKPVTTASVKPPAPPPPPPPTVTTATVATPPPPPPPPVTTGGFTSSIGPDGLLVLTPKS